MMQGRGEEGIEGVLKRAGLYENWKGRLFRCRLRVQLKKRDFFSCSDAFLRLKLGSSEAVTCEPFPKHAYEHRQHGFVSRFLLRPRLHEFRRVTSFVSLSPQIFVRVHFFSFQY